MARDSDGRRPWRGSGDNASGPVAEPTPLDQLDAWRLGARQEWSHDTAEFPAYGATPYPAGDDERTEVIGAVPATRGRRPGAGLLVGLGLVAAALLLGGLASAGVGPVRSLLGSNDPQRTPSGTSSTSGTAGSGTATAGSQRGVSTGVTSTPSSGAQNGATADSPAGVGPAANGPGAKGPGAKRPAANGPGAKGPGAKGPGAVGPGAKEPGGAAPVAPAVPAN